ncbi:hypothetical protein BD410DRAFT_901154 [Rickenella mellea]|uniref:Uncharacterized protein n=1 Tax=Rickenella mellea TaxID=50990 RepID=A0A4Y7PTT8_9AGAM|nr:hypothetical protein BD410DRAFT_901154 [Rickenella mellea]
MRLLARSTIFNDLSNHFHTFLRLLSLAVSNNDTGDTPFLRGFASIDGYVGYLVAYYDRLGLKALSDFTVIEVYHCKAKTRKSFENEYISSKLRGPDGHTFFLVFERSVGDGEAPSDGGESAVKIQEHAQVQTHGGDLAQAREQPPPMHTGSASPATSFCSLCRASSGLSIIEILSLRGRTVSMVNLCHGRFQKAGDELGKTFTMKEDRPLYLYELALLAHAVHRRCGEDGLYRDQFAAILGKAIQEKCDAVESYSANSPDKYQVLEENDIGNELEPVKKIFREECQEFLGMIGEAENRTRQKEMEDWRQMEEERRQMEEAENSLREERRQLEEARAEMARLTRQLQHLGIEPQP